MEEDNRCTHTFAYALILEKPCMTWLKKLDARCFTRRIGSEWIIIDERSEAYAHGSIIKSRDGWWRSAPPPAPTPSAEPSRPSDQLLPFHHHKEKETKKQQRSESDQLVIAHHALISLSFVLSQTLHDGYATCMRYATNRGQ